MLTKMFEFNRWANLTLIDECRRLSEQQLAVTADGVAGQIMPLLRHTVSAEGGYLNRTMGSRPWPLETDWESTTLDDLYDKAELSGRLLIAAATEADPNVRHETEYEGQPYIFHNWNVLLQAIYHGIEHRTQIKALLTVAGIEHSDLSLWDYTETLQ